MTHTWSKPPRPEPSRPDPPRKSSEPPAKLALARRISIGRWDVDPEKIRKQLTRRA